MSVQHFRRLRCDTCDVSQEIADNDPAPTLVQGFKVIMGDMAYFDGHLCEPCRKSMRVNMDGFLQEYLRKRRSEVAA